MSGIAEPDANVLLWNGFPDRFEHLATLRNLMQVVKRLANQVDPHENQPSLLLERQMQTNTVKIYYSNEQQWLGPKVIDNAM